MNSKLHSLHSLTHSPHSLTHSLARSLTLSLSHFSHITRSGSKRPAVMLRPRPIPAPDCERGSQVASGPNSCRGRGLFLLRIAQSPLSAKGKYTGLMGCLVCAASKPLPRNRCLCHRPCPCRDNGQSHCHHLAVTASCACPCPCLCRDHGQHKPLALHRSVKILAFCLRALP